MPPDVPSANDIRDAAREVLQGPDYQLESDAAAQSGVESLLVRALRWLWDGFLALAESLSFLPAVLSYPLFAFLCGLLVYMIYRIVRALVWTARLPGISDESVRARSNHAASPKELEALAEAARRDGQIVEGVRCLLHASLARLELAEKRRPRPGATNRELLRRYRATPLSSPLKTLVDTIDLHWYGDRPADPQDFERCSASYDQLRLLVSAGASEDAEASTTTR